MNIDRTISAYNKVSNDLIRMMVTVINSPNIQNLAKQLNQLQLSKGQRSDGTILPDYSDTSVNVFGKPKGAMTLYDEGDFYRGFKLMMTGNGGMMVSTDSKFEELKRKYGELIMGLNEKNEIYLTNKINAELMLLIDSKI